MLETKFRVYDTHIKRMSDPFEMWAKRITFSGEALMVAKENLIVMQFTGKHDKNGAEIYKGMILDCNVGVSGQSKRVKVLVKSGCPCHVFPNGQLYQDNIVQAVIIGNEFEHPELLKETQ